MTSIHTNISAITALHTLRSITSELSETQHRVSSGLRVKTASDNSAYWSISTTMRSDNLALSAVTDALGLGAAKVDVAYTGMEAVIDILGDFKAKLVAAREPGVDKAKIQKELAELKNQVVSIATSASFNGQNWLSTDIPDIFDETLNRSSVVSSFVRDAGGNITVKSLEVALSETSLFNLNGGGLLQADPRDFKTVGGLRYPYATYSDGTQAMSTHPFNQRGSRPGYQTFAFSGAFTFGAADTISFDITVDADDPADVPPPHNPGVSKTVVIDRSTVDAALGTSDGVIADYKQYTAVIARAMQNGGASTNAFVTTFTTWDNDLKKYVDVPDVIGFNTSENSGLNGSSIQITNVSSTIGMPGLAATAISYGPRNSDMTLNFEPFTVYSDTVVSFNLAVENETPLHYSFDKDYVNGLLGITSGEISTSAEMALLLNSLINRSDVTITAAGPGTITVEPDPNLHKKAGSKSGIAFTGVNVSIEPIGTRNFRDIDVDQHPDMIDAYIGYMDIVTSKIVDSAATLGALQKRIEIQSNFTMKLMDTIDKGIGRLVDADMNEESVRLKALQTQEKLAIQALQIANATPKSILSLFQ
ncbi:flagellin [Hoeflea sp. G2-23]|uniref:Flagellin n=1 Tax=Hoeflea algicola TaxID=2983763 RepID=A0ABT3ZBW4_9HYPH|nr:flagellin [Hoeflea algicola]MCY0149295.1 flagellin [Hoeflea algicola]